MLAGIEDVARLSPPAAENPFWQKLSALFRSRNELFDFLEQHNLLLGSKRKGLAFNVSYIIRFDANEFIFRLYEQVTGRGFDVFLLTLTARM